MAPHSSTRAWKIPWIEEPGRLQSMESPESDTTERLHFHFSLARIGEGNGNPLQCSCLENPRDGEAWWAAVYGVAQSRTWLKWLSSNSSSILFCTAWTVTAWPLCPWDFPGKNTGVCCHFLLQGIFSTQGSNPGLLIGKQILYHWAPREAIGPNWEVLLNFLHQVSIW